MVEAIIHLLPEIQILNLKLLAKSALYCIPCKDEDAEGVSEHPKESYYYHQLAHQDGELK